MNKIIPFVKNLTFKNKIGEITSIALDDTLKLDGDNYIKGDLIVRGCYRENKDDLIELSFSYTLPVDITIDMKYDTTKCTIGIDDFYYEIINEEQLKVNIDLILDNLFYHEEEKEQPQSIDNITIESNIEEHHTMVEDIRNDVRDKTKIKDIEDLFKETNEEKVYSVYRVYTVLENETLEYIMDKYHVTKEDLVNYNNLDIIKPGTKLIIPSIDE